MSFQEETIQVLYNNCYGGWGASDKALQLYNDRMSQLDTEHKFITCSSELWRKRHDSLLVEIFHELGNDFNPEYSNVKIATIPKKYEKYYTITEYDGLESVNIDINQYKLDTITQILENDTMSSDEKIKKIYAVL